MKMFYEKDADVELIKGKKVAIFGYGSQGHAHALNLKDSGVKEIVVALREGSSSVAKAESKGLRVMNLSDAAAWADVVMILTPDDSIIECGPGKVLTGLNKRIITSEGVKLLSINSDESFNEF